MNDNTSRHGPESVQNPDETAGQTTVPIAEGATRLGISVDAVRKRIHRGKLTGHKTDGGWIVVWTESDTSPDNIQTSVRDASALVESLQSQVDYLREQVTAERDARTEAERRHAAEIERRDVLLREALERIPQMPLGLPAGTVTHEYAPQDANTASQRGDAPQMTGCDLGRGSRRAEAGQRQPGVGLATVVAADQGSGIVERRLAVPRAELDDFGRAIPVLLRIRPCCKTGAVGRRA